MKGGQNRQGEVRYLKTLLLGGVKMKKLFLIVLLIAVALALVPGCTSTPTETPKETYTLKMSLVFGETLWEWETIYLPQGLCTHGV